MVSTSVFRFRSSALVLK